jgi:taurine dioxygenase
MTESVSDASSGTAMAGCRLGSRLSPAAGVAVTGIDLAQPLTRDQRETIVEALCNHRVVVFPGQSLTREQQFAFAANFGEVEHHGGRGGAAKRYGVAHVLSNLDANGTPVDRSSSAVSNYRWHTDKAYYPVPPMLTMLYAVELPPHGGDTEFANTALAYAALPEATKQQIAGLRVVFRWGAGLGSADEAARAYGELARRPAVAHPLVRTHPETGVKALYLGNHSSHIEGLPTAESAALLDRLLAHATRPEFVYAHRWQAGELVMWDNRCLLHRAVANYDLARDRRVLHRVVVRGSVPF